MKYLSLVLFVLFISACQNEEQDKDVLTLQEVKEDLAYFDTFLTSYSAYTGLNGYNYREAFTNYTDTLTGNVTKNQFGLFLTQTIAQLGDRHAYVSGYDFPGERFLPFAFAPYEGKVVILTSEGTSQQYQLYDQAYPRLTAVEGTPIKQFLAEVLPEEIKAPQAAYFTKATRRLRDIAEIYHSLGKPLPDPIRLTFASMDQSQEKEVSVNLVGRDQRRRKWDEAFYRQFFLLDEEDFNKKEVIDQLFTVEDSIARFQLPDMVAPDKAPALYQAFAQFMEQVRTESKAIIIDVRSNGGGVRDLIWEMAGYFVPKDAVFVVNAAQQRGELPLSEEWQEDLHNRFLFAYEELDEREQAAVDQFNTTFKPMYELDDTKYSPFYYAIFNGQKLSPGKYFYDRPIYILANESSFSAASVLVATFKGLPNVKIAGTTTDGSSGNSERFRLPKSELRGKISTMISFQKNGQVLDGIGTAPDIRIPRSLDQIFWRTDTQLEELKKWIREGKN